jgi:hypothetical protein
MDHTTTTVTVSFASAHPAGNTSSGCFTVPEAVAYHSKSPGGIANAHLYKPRPLAVVRAHMHTDMIVRPYEHIYRHEGKTHAMPLALAIGARD